MTALDLRTSFSSHGWDRVFQRFRQEGRVEKRGEVGRREERGRGEKTEEKRGGERRNCEYSN